MEKKYWIKKKAVILVWVLLAILVFGAAVMGLWNAILPQVVSGVKPISFLQALGILLLSKILFGGFRGGWGGRHKRGRWMEMKEKFANMTPEEKEKWKSEWKSRCGGRLGRQVEGPDA
jgi:heme A synthase